jgi:hypothetical protein
MTGWKAAVWKPAARIGDKRVERLARLVSWMKLGYWISVAGMMSGHAT